MARIGDNILDTRDVDAIIEDLELEEEEYIEALENDDVETQKKLQPEMDELKELRFFKAALDGYCDWHHGETLIHEKYCVDYVKDFANEIGALGDNSDWIQIDWEATADEFFRFDFTSAEIRGDTYYVRTC